MKKTGLFAASVAVAVASATSLSAPPSSAGLLKTTFSHQENVTRDEEITTPSGRSPPLMTTADQFAPKIDGLRFIETLVTAHR